MKTFLEKFSLLSLSLMLVSTLSPSTALPQLITTFHQQGYAASQVEFLFSLSSFAILAMLLLNPIIERLISERLSIILGLLLIAFGGSMPVVFQTYSLVFVSRILLGIGIGLINSRAISIISETYAGREQAQMLGLRGSFEIIGNALLTMIVGFIVVIGWSWTFSVYLFALFLHQNLRLKWQKSNKMRLVLNLKKKISCISSDYLYWQVLLLISIVLTVYAFQLLLTNYILEVLVKQA